MGIILASKSPRRKEILGNLGLGFKIISADVDETMDEGRFPGDEAARISLLKAKKVACEAKADDVVIGADTVVYLKGRFMGKPKDETEAFEMLKALSGNVHQVFTGITVMRGTDIQNCFVATDVHFRKLDNSEIMAYIKTGEPADKAGAYGIQGLGAAFIDHIDGDYYNVVGLPVSKLYLMLKEFGVKII